MGKRTLLVVNVAATVYMVASDQSIIEGATYLSGWPRQREIVGAGKILEGGGDDGNLANKMALRVANATVLAPVLSLG